MKHLAAILPLVLFLLSYAADAKSLLENCADNKLKEYRTKNMVTIAEEPELMRKFRAECAKNTFTTPAEKQALAAEAQAADRQAILDKEAKDKAAAAAKPPVAPPKPAAPAPSTASPATSATPATSVGGFVPGGCGDQAQCEAYMKEARTPKYTWSSPGLQAYLGELWGNNFSYAHSLGGTFEQPENPCKESNQGQMIGLDLGTEVIAVSCMSSMATQEEIKAMAEKIKNTKVETLKPVVIAVKKPKYEWKVIVEPKRTEGQQCFCTHPGSCTSEILGKEVSEHSCCGTVKCIRIDGGPVKSTREKKTEPSTTVKAADPAPTSNTAPPPPPPPTGYDRERDGAAGP